MEVVLLFTLVIGLLLIGVPIAVSLGLSSIIFLLANSETSLASIAQSLYQAMAGHYTLLAIPFFILASSFMSTGGVAKRIIRFSIACVGHLRGGLAIAGVFACIVLSGRGFFLFSKSAEGVTGYISQISLYISLRPSLSAESSARERSLSLCACVHSIRIAFAHSPTSPPA